MLGAPRMFARRARSLSTSTRSCSQARPPMRCATPLSTSGRCASTVAAPLPTTTTTTSMCMPPCLRLVGGCSGRTPALFAATSARFSPPQHLHHDVERIEDLLIPHEDAATIRTVVDLVRLLVDPLATHGRRGGLENVSLATFVAMPEQRQLIALGGDVAMHDVLKSSEYYAAYRDVRTLRLAGITTLSGWERMMMMMQSSTSSSSVCVDLSPYSRGVLERALTERNAKNNAGAQRGSADGQETNVLAWLTATIQKAVAEELRRGDAETPLLLPHARQQQQQQQHDDDDDAVADATITTNVPENVVDVQPEEVEESWLHPRGRRGSSRRGDANNNKKKDVVADDEEAIRVIAAEDELAEEEEVVAVESVAARRPTRRRGGASASSPTTAPPEEVEEEEVVEIVEEVEEQVAADDDDAAANVDVDGDDHDDDDAHARSAEEEEATAAMDEFNDDVASLAEDAPPPPKTKSPSRTPTSANNKIADDAETDEAELVHEEEEEEAAPPPPTTTTAATSSSPPNPKLSRLADLMLRQFNAADGYLHSPRKELRQEEKHGQVIRVDDDTAQVDPLALFSTYHSAQVSSSDPMHVHALKRVWSQYNAHQMAMEEAHDEAVDVFQKEKSVQALIYGAVLLRALSREEDVRLQPLLTTGSTCVAEQDVEHSGAVMMMPPPPNFGFPLLSSDVRPFKSKRPRSSPHTNVTAEDVAQGMEEYKHFLANAHNRASPFQPAIDVNGGCSVVSIVGSTLHLYETSIKDAVREEEVRRPFAEAMIGVLHLLRHGVLTRINTIHYHVLVTMLPSSEEEAGNMHHAHGSSLTTFVSIDVGGRFNSSERSRFAALTRPLGMEAEVAEYACLEDIINVVEEECSVSVVHDLLISREDLEALLTPTLVQLLPEVELAEEAEEEEMKMAEVAVATSSRKEAAATNVHDDEEEEEEEEVIEEEEVVEEVAEEEEEKEEPQQQQQQHYEEEEVVPAPAAGADEELGNDDEEEYEEVVEEYEVVEEEEEEAEAPPPPPASRSNNRREASASQRRPPPPPPVDEVEEDEPTPAAQPPRRTSRWFDDDDDDAHAAAAPPRRRAAPVATPPPPPPPQRTRAPVVERDDDDEEEVVVQRPRTRAANAGRRAAAPRAPEKVEEDDGDRWHIRRSGRR